MPREATISYEQVAVIAQAIKADGGKPSPRLIRERHGSGSLGTIHKLFQQWVSKESNQIETTIALPPGLQRVILEFVHQEEAGLHQTGAGEETTRRQPGRQPQGSADRRRPDRQAGGNGGHVGTPAC